VQEAVTQSGMLHMRPRFKTVLLMTLLGVVVACVLTLWSRHSAIISIENEQRRGLRCKWQMPTNGKLWPYSTAWAVWLPGAKLSELSVDYDIGNPEELGQAVRQLGGAVKLSIGQGKAETVTTFLSGLGPESTIREIYIFNVAVPNEATHVLASFKSLHDLAIVLSEITGESMPLLPELVTLDLSTSRVTDAGLKRLVALPKLEAISISGPAITAEGIRGLSINTAALKELVVTDSTIAASSVAELKEHMSRQRPSFVLDITD
jgi:hypothetical protein